MRVGSLFSGIGGIDLGLERAGMSIAWQCEKDPWCRKILTKHWPEVPKYEDVTTLDAQTVEPVDVLAGGFPCQDLSVAGKQAGILEGARSSLWGEFSRFICALRPRYVFVENVPGLLIQPGLGVVLGDLAECGYDAEWQVLSAAAFGANHLRKRVWIVAHCDGKRQRQPQNKADAGRNRRAPWMEPHVSGSRCELKQSSSSMAHPAGERLERRIFSQAPWSAQSEFAGHGQSALCMGYSYHWQVEPAVGRVVDGVPHRVDRLRGLGNAVVPQVVEWIGRQMMKMPALLILLVGLSGCQFFDPIETLDQLGHYGAGQLIACDAAKWVSPEAAVAHTMAFAKTREELQHPGQCREGCQRDLATWQRGAEHGATCAVSSRTKEAL